MRDPKSSFYKYLNLDNETSKILKWYRKISKDLQNDKYTEEEKELLKVQTSTKKVF